MQRCAKKNRPMRILAIIESTDFRNYPRRATIEAISKMSGAMDVLCDTHVRNLFKTKLQSPHVNIFRHYRWFPLCLLKRSSFLMAFHVFLLKIFDASFWRQYDVFLLTVPDQRHLLPLCRGTVAFLLSDPFHMRGPHMADLKAVVSRADLILATSKNLQTQYLQKYFGHTKTNIYYWPNTVDLAVWDYTRFVERRVFADPPVIGYAGNFWQGLDVELMDKLTDRFPEYEFQFAGRITFREDSYISKLESIFRKKNVTFLGFIPFDELPVTVMNWDICIVPDARCEHGSYIHHNKLYQYLALGKPVVIRRNHHDYDAFQSLIDLCESDKDFIDAVERAMARRKDKEFIRQCLVTVGENASPVRARQFLQILEEFEAS